MPNKTRVYDRMAPRYDSWMRPCERIGLARLRAAVLASMPEGGRLLEVGAGTGGNFPFYPRDAHAACAEPSREMLLRAQVKPERPSGAALFQSVAEALPFADDTFDAAVRAAQNDAPIGHGDVFAAARADCVAAVAQALPVQYCTV